jgi:hypothetical protein
MPRITRCARAAQDAQINKPIDLAEACWIVGIVAAGFIIGPNATLWLNRHEVEQYNADPDGYAAKSLGFVSVEEYHEFVAVNGDALCCERTWRELHRAVPCETHGGVAKGPSPEKSRRKSRYPIADDRRCQALAYPSESPQSWSFGPHHCGLSGKYIRDGRRVCHIHRDRNPIAYACDATAIAGGNHE